MLLLWSDERLLTLPCLPVPTRSAVSQVNIRTLLHSGLSSNVQKPSSHYDRGYGEEAAQRDLGCLFFFFFKWIHMGPHPPKRFILECFFLALPPIPVRLACLGFQRGAPEVRWLPPSGCLLLALSAPSGLLHTVSAGHHGTETQRCSLCPATATTKLWYCVFGLPSPGCCGVPGWSRSCPAVYRFGRVAPRPPPSERWWPHPRLRTLKSKGDLGIVCSGSPLKMKATLSMQIYSVKGCGCCCDAFMNAWIQNTNMHIWAEGRRDEQSWGAAFPPEKEHHTCGEEGITYGNIWAISAILHNGVLGKKKKKKSSQFWGFPLSSIIWSNFRL